MKRQFTGIFVPQESGNPYLMVSTRSDRPRNGDYQFVVKPLQPLNDTDESVELSIGQTRDDHINFVEDYDFFHFHAEESKGYLVTVIFPTGLDPIAQVWFEGQDDWTRHFLDFDRKSSGSLRATFRTWDFATKYNIRISDLNRTSYTITLNELR